MKKTGILLFWTISLLSIYVAYKILVSYRYQVALTQDWGRAEQIFPIEEIEKIDTDFPNLTTAALPLDAMKMRYYLKEGLVDTLETFFKKSAKANPFMGVEHNILSQYIYNIGDYDSAYKLAKKAFSKLSNNQLHGSVLISSLIKLDSLDQAVKVFESIKYKTDAHYTLFLRSLIEARDTLYLKKYLDESRSFLSENKEFKQFDQMQKISYDNYFTSEGYNQMAKIDFDEGFITSSLKKYKKSIELNPFNSGSYINIGKILLKEYSDSIVTSNSMFKKAIELDSSNGEAFYYLGVSEFIINKLNKDSICKIFDKSLKLGYDEARPIMKEYGCLF